jgi:hypothetical protein
MRWGASFLKSLLSNTHKQWLFRNSDVHHIIDGLMTHQHALLNQCIHDLIQTTPKLPKELLPMHYHLLQQDFAQLGNADTLQQQIWVASMESALGAASHFSYSHLTPCSLHRFFCPQSHPCLSLSGAIPSRQNKPTTSPNTLPTMSTNSTGVLLGPPKHPPTISSPTPLAFN